MYRSLLVKNSKLISSKGLLLKSSISPVSSRMLLHNSTYVRNNNKVNVNQTKSSTKGSKQEKQKTFESEPKLNNNNSRNAKILSLLAAGGALYFVSPYKPSFKNKSQKKEVPHQKEDEFVNEPTITEETSKLENEEESNEEKAVDQESKALEDVDTEKLDKTEEEVKQEGAYNEETGEINWDCECLGGMAYGPCGEEFKEAFACFVYSEADPKGIDCVEKFQNMQTCFRKHPEHYADQLKDDEEVNEEIIKQNEQDGDSVDSSENNLINVSLESSPEVNGEEAITIDREVTPDISKEETVMVEDVSESTDNDSIDPIEEIELTESS
ncbi:mitochondrial intermembrane space import and assembly protein 40 [Monosporozyma servazzii]